MNGSDKSHVIFVVENHRRRYYDSKSGEFHLLEECVPTRYTDEESKKLRREMLEPLIRMYQRTGRNYREIWRTTVSHMGK